MFDPWDPRELAKRLREPRIPVIAVIGDVMLDEHVTCEVLGLSPEDDLAPKLKILSRRWSAGGAANVAANLHGLGAEVTLAGAVGDDEAALNLSRLLRKQTVDAQSLKCTGNWEATFTVCKERPTTVKTRFVTTRGRHVIRVDEESQEPLKDSDVQNMYKLLMRELAPNLLVVSDYAKGVVTPSLMSEIHRHGLKTIVGPKKANLLEYGAVYALVPNEREMRLASDNGDAAGDVALSGLRYHAEHVVVTLAEHGCVFTHPGDKMQSVPTRPREIVDPAGCGDSFLAGLSYALALGWSMHEACVLGNVCGGCAAGHIGVRVVAREEIIKELEAMV